MTAPMNCPGQDRPSSKAGRGLGAGVLSDVEVSIVVPTFRRQDQLAALIPRCFAQAGIDWGMAEIIVVDNCPQQSARPLVEMLRTTFGPSLRYVTEKRPGVSHVRNAGIRAARGRFIGFIDDDELPGDNWLMGMLACQRRFEADVVLGPVHPHFVTPGADDDGFLRKTFTQTSECPSGTRVEPLSVLGVLLRRARCYRPMATNNALFAKARCITSDEPFAPALGHLGGEDVLFFSDLYLAGKNIVWCREAPVFERIPGERLALGYLLRKRYRNGQIASIICSMTTPRQYRRLFFSMLVGLLQVTIGGGFTVVSAFVSTTKTRAALCMVAGGLGKVLWMKPFHGQSYGAIADGGKVALTNAADIVA